MRDLYSDVSDSYSDEISSDETKSDESSSDEINDKQHMLTVGAGDHSDSVGIHLADATPYLPVLGAFVCEMNKEQVESSGETTCEEVECPDSEEGSGSTNDSSTPYSEAYFNWEELLSGNKRGSEMMDDTDSIKNTRELKRASIEMNLKKKKNSAYKQYQALIRLAESKGTKETGMNIIDSVLSSLTAVYDQHKDPHAKQRSS